MHRFYIAPGSRELRQHLWIDDKDLVHQWQKVLRFKVGDELVLFDGDCDKLYKINRAEETSFHLEHVTDMVQNLPRRKVYLFWSLLKKDKNDWVLQKCTELGVSNFVPIISKRTETKYLDEDRSKKIIIEAAEQCGRSDIPYIHEPMSLEQAVKSYKDKVTLFTTHMEGESSVFNPQSSAEAVGVFIGPEGGWTGDELNMFKAAGLQTLQISDMTLRAETAAISAAYSLLN